MIIKVPDINYDFGVYGMKRSGHHAIIHWILNHYHSSIHYHDCFFKDNQFYCLNKNEVIKLGKYPYRVKILSFEDRPNIFESSIDIVCQHVRTKRNILILRDAYNNYASRYKKKMDVPNNVLDKIWINFDNVEIWKMYAKEFIGETNYLNAIKVNYNLWFQDIEYRKELSKNFGLFTDHGIQDVLEFGSGSSFDFRKLNKKAQHMKVFERWKKYYFNNHYYKKIILDKEIEKLNKKIFGFVVPKIFF